MQEQLPTRIKDWLNSRGISDEVLTRHNVHWDGHQIVIPVYDQSGIFLFNKYRRDPEVTEGPKYRYDKGGTSVLYALDNFAHEYTVLCEGELDCLALLSKNIHAVTSTGGASAFSPEWRSLLSEPVFICYDTDQAGIKGAYHVHSLLPGSKIIWLPKKIKDVTEYFVNLGKTRDDFLTLFKEAWEYPMPQDWQIAETKKGMQAFKDSYKASLDLFLRQAGELRATYQSDEHLQILIGMFNNKLAEVNRALKYFGNRRGQSDPNRISAAKSVPIAHYIKFNHQKMACCIWHDEKTPSMYWYEKQNRVKCFGCNRLGDVIDVVQQLRRVGLKEALDIILNK